MKRIIFTIAITLVISTTAFSVIFEDFEDGDYSANPTWWLYSSQGDGTITNDPLNQNNLAWKAYGTDSGHRRLSTNVSGVAWNNFDFTMDYLPSASGNFHGACWLEPEAGIPNVFRIGLWYDTNKNADARIYIIEDGPVSQDLRTWISISNILRNEWLNLHAWYDDSSGFITAEVRIRETGTLLGQVSLTPELDMIQAGDIAVLNVGIEETNWQYIDNVVFTPEPTTIVLLGLGGLMLRRRNRR